MVLDADIHVAKDSKRQYSFCISCKGVQEMCFATDDEEHFVQWFSRLQKASKAYEMGMWLKIPASGCRIQRNVFIVCYLDQSHSTEYSFFHGQHH